MLPDETRHRFVAILNKKVEIGKLMNALGHMTAGLAGGYGISKEMHFLEYKDGNGNLHPHISHFPFIVLQADNSNQIRNLKKEIVTKNIFFTDFTSTMTIGTSNEQQKNTAKTQELDLEYYGICVFGKTDELKILTKKFSIFK